MAEEGKIFISKPMMNWLEDAQKLRPIQPLFPPFWYEGETCFFFGSTGIGKTLFSMQMAHIISQRKKVLYFDFEMSDRQLLMRYEEDGKVARFSENLIRGEISKDIYVDSKKLMGEIVKEIDKHEAEVIIIDNITWLLEDTQDAKTAIPFMKEVSSIKREKGISVLIIAHTPKRRSTSSMAKNSSLSSFDTPLELADMAGSAALSNFIDSCFAIGKSRKDDSLRYLKQLKTRNSETVHGEENVLVWRLERIREGFLGFTKQGEEPEYDHIVRSSNKTERDTEIRRLDSEGLSQRKIGERFGISHTHVNRILKKPDGSIQDGTCSSPDE